MRGDVSFTFLDRIEEIERNIRDERWQSALALSLTLPDICGGIAYPELVKRYRDGRVMPDRYGNPSRDIGAQYIQWFDEFAAEYFKKSPQDEKSYICGKRCWQLRCEYLHQNRGFLNTEEDPEIHFSLGVNCGSSICHLDEEVSEDGMDIIRLDIKEICLRLTKAARAYYDRFHEEKDFHLYNTPVIDFIKWNQSYEDDKRNMIILTQNDTYGKGIAQILDSPKLSISVCNTLSDVRRRTKKKKIDFWIVESEFLDNGLFDDLDRMSCCILVLTSRFSPSVREDPGFATLTKPVSPDSLRSMLKNMAEKRRLL